MKKKIIGLLCSLISVLVAIGILCNRYISNERKADENNYISAAKAVAYEINEYLETGNEEYFGYAAADIVQMNKLSESAGNILNSSQRKIIYDLSSIVEFNKDRLIDESQRLKEAFEIIGENKENLDYAYTQIKIALKNCGL